jgi:hypothetical protein
MYIATKTIHGVFWSVTLVSRAKTWQLGMAWSKQWEKKKVVFVRVDGTRIGQGKKSVLLRMRRDEVTARESRLQMDREATDMRYSTRCWRLARTSWATAAPPFSIV